MEKVPPAKKESNIRSLLKAFSWRVVATLTTGTIAWILLPDEQKDKAFWIMSIEFVIKFFIYYAHERAWQLVPHGSFPRVKGR